MTDQAPERASPAAASRPGETTPLGVVVVNYGSSDLLRRNLTKLSNGPTVVVVDNYSTDDERRAVADLATEHGWELVGLPDNRGFGGGVNAGVAVARRRGCETFLCLNPDAVITPEVAARLAEHSLREPLTLISPTVVDSAGATFFAGARLHLRDGRVRGWRSPAARPAGEVREWLSGACLVVHRQLFDRLGGFDESYFLYWEDVDLSHRAYLVGGTTALRADLVVVHDEGGTQGERRGRAKSDLYYRYNCRNRLAFAACNLGRREMLRWLLCTPPVSWEMLLRGGRRQLLQSPRPLLAAIRGSLEGAALVLAALTRTGAAPGAADLAAIRDRR